jgi:hypothetical protein
MGQAAVELPDPLQAAPESPKTSTDELLSQLAGEEIDRLLAEVDAGAPRDARAAASPIDVSPPLRPELEKEQEGVAPAAPEGVAEPAAPSSKDETVTAELDALFSAAVEKDKADEEAAAAAAAIAAEQTSAAERAGLSTVAAMAPAPEAAVEDDNAPLPLYLRPLEWLNAPLMIFPPAVRDLVGKVAIVTLINAVAILAYVLIVRRG